MCGIAKYTFHISAFSLAAVKGKKGEDKKSKRGRTVTAPRLEKNIWNLASTARRVTHWRVRPESKEEEYLINHQMIDEGDQNENENGEQNENANVEQNDEEESDESESETESEEEQWTIDHKFLMFVNIYMYIFYACKRIFLFIEYDINIIHLVLLFSNSMPRSKKHRSH